MSMAGGWFFLMINEAFVLGGQDFRLPGLGSYMSVAADAGRRAGDGRCACVAMVADDRAARPGALAARGGLGPALPRRGEPPRPRRRAAGSCDLLRRSRLLRRLQAWRLAAPAAADATRGDGRERRARFRRPPRRLAVPAPRGRRSPLAVLALLLAYGAVRLAHLLLGLPVADRGRLLLGRGRRHPRPRAALDRSRHAVGGAGRPRHRPLAAAVAAAPAGGPGGRVVPGADAVPCRRSRSSHSPASSLGCGSVAADAARHPVVHPVQRHRRARCPSPPTCARRPAASASAAGSACGRCTSRPSSPTW